MKLANKAKIIPIEASEASVKNPTEVSFKEV